MAEPLKILIVDPHPDAVANLRRALNSFGTLEVVGDAGFGPVASTWAHTLDPAIVMVSVEEPLTRSLTTIQALTRGNPRWTVRESGKPEVARHEQIAVDIASLDSANIATGMSQALATLADRIAAQLGNP